jgi:HprK-related kinase A
VKIGELSAVEIGRRLRGSGLAFGVGPFIVSAKGSHRGLAKPFHVLYADFTICETCDFADFHVEIERRRWWRPQVLFWFDGKTPFYPLWGNLEMPLFEWGLNWCISNFAHQYCVIHSAVLERDGLAIMICGPAGSGKSTLAAGLASSGWRILSDELALIRPEDGQAVALSRPLSLKNDSINAIQRLATDSFTHLEWFDPREGTIALMAPPRHSVNLMAETALPAWILFVSYRAGAEVEIKPVMKSRAFLRVAGNTLNYSVLGITGFKTVAGIIDRCECYDFSYSDLQDAIQCIGQLRH